VHFDLTIIDKFGFQVLLGLSGVVLVLLSVLGSMGFFSAIGVKSTLIIMEVIPFLVLAVSLLTVVTDFMLNIEMLQEVGLLKYVSMYNLCLCYIRDWLRLYVSAKRNEPQFFCVYLP
jgi:Ca2+/Na+ antiporter